MVDEKTKVEIVVVAFQEEHEKRILLNSSNTAEWLTSYNPESRSKFEINSFHLNMFCTISWSHDLVIMSECFDQHVFDFIGGLIRVNPNKGRLNFKPCLFQRSHPLPPHRRIKDIIGGSVSRR